MENVVSSIEDTNVWIDDVGVFWKDWKHQMNVLTRIFCRLQENGYNINPMQCEWIVQETDWLTPKDLKSGKRKIETILHIDKKCTIKELCMLIGCINYYTSIRPSCADILKTFTIYSGFKKCAPIKWAHVM